ncbi:substrate-binding periplasmic protein [Marinobacter salicampi]|uniref:substrate-binding periplasmic protein n=1 Tax=Marinobacter salicampi TaxID=435907 RepID=UPI0014080CDC|nr:transporter substrate-binding domain-containing protein [Marinobacter salicampi]
MTTLTLTKHRLAAILIPFKTLILLLLVSFWAGAVLGSEESKRVLKVGYVEFPPFEYRDENGDPAGEFIDLTRKVADEAGYGLRFIYVPISRVYFYLQRGAVDMFPGLTNIHLLQGSIVESSIKPIQVQLSAWSRQSTPPPAQFSDFQNKVLILIAGYSYGGLIDVLREDPSIRLTEAPSHGAAINMLRRGRGDYLLDYKPPVEEVLKGDSEHSGLTQTPVRKRYGSWLFSLKQPDVHHVKADFDTAYWRLVERGEVIHNINFPPVDTLPGYPIDLTD